MNHEKQKQMKKLFYWDKDTINHFRFQSSFDCKDKVISDATSFVENCCDIEPGETEEMLIEDLTNQVYTQEEDEENISNCCGANPSYLNESLCGDCLEHADFN